MSIAIIDYGSGNLHSVVKAFQLAADACGQTVSLSNDPAVVAAASHIVLPGVGAYGDCVTGLSAIDGMVDVLHEAVTIKERYFFGICVGMQMMLTRGLEHGEHKGLGWIEGDCVPITPADASLKIPHMGWNELIINQPDHPLFSGISTGDHVYYVHSYHAQCVQASDVLAQSDYGGPISACIGKNNMIGTQFHPEKSSGVGLQLIRNFVGQ